MTELVRYNEMRRAIEACHAVDEVKDIRDKAVAMQHYSRLALDLESERQCIAIRLRAERKAGQLLKEMPKAPGVQRQLAGRDASGGRVVRPPENREATLADMGISKDQSSKWQKLADVPEDKFEEALADTSAPPSTAGILRQHGPRPQQPETPPAPPGFVQATKAIGRIRDLAAYCRENDPEFVAGGVYDYELADLRTNVQAVQEWLERLAGHLKETT